jgi:hypothetical protein
VHDLGFWEHATENGENYSTFRQILQLPYSGLMCSGCFGRRYVQLTVGGEREMKPCLDETEVRGVSDAE